MATDSITDEIRRIRRDLAAQFGNDLDLILADIRKREASDGRTYVSLSPRFALQKTDEQTDEREPE
jgi:hypothetical protein